MAFVMCNSKLKNKQTTRNLTFDFDYISSDDEWITEDWDSDEEARLEEDDDELEAQIQQYFQVDGTHGCGGGSIDKMLDLDFTLEDDDEDNDSGDDSGENDDMM